MTRSSDFRSGDIVFAPLISERGMRLTKISRGKDRFADFVYVDSGVADCFELGLSDPNNKEAIAPGIEKVIRDGAIIYPPQPGKEA